MTSFTPASPRSFVYEPPDTPLDIIFADSDILVLNKPSGLLTVAGKTPDLADCLESRACELYQTARIIHRLDKDTSGLIVLGLTTQAHANIGLQFEKRQTEKAYMALVWGELAQSSGRIEQPICADWPNRPKQHIDHENGRAAITDWEVLESDGANTRVLLKPMTGRTHQLRVHMTHIGHPILGDNLYAHSSALTAAPRLCLHAIELSFTHPATGDQIGFSSEVPF